MRLKGINPVEQHVEKLVAGLFAVALLGVLTWQFIAKPSTVKVGTADKPMAEAYEEVARQARTVDTKIRAPEPVGMPSQADAVKIVEKYKDFDKSIAAPVAPKPELARALDNAAPIGVKGIEAAGAASTAIAELHVPAPTGALAATFLSTVSQSEAQNSEVAKILPAAQPFDKAAVTVEGMFDGTKLKAALMDDPDGDGPIRSIPKNWWDGGVQILAVELHRQTLKPDNSWTADEKVGSMPGRTLVLDSVDKLNDALQLKDASKYASDQFEMVRRTPYYNSTFGEKWLPPSEREADAAASADKATEIDRLKRQLAQRERELKTLQDRLAKVGQPVAPSPGQTGGGHGGGGGGGGATGGGGHGGGGAGGGGSAPPAPTGPSTADEQAKKQIASAIAKKQDQITQDKTKLRALGVPVEGDTAAPMPDPNAKPTKTESPVLDNAAIKLWAHDVFVERGKTYRYQMVLVLTNPYFGHSAAMLPDQAARLAKVGVMRSAPSEWTDPITVDPETYLFFTSAAEDDSASGRIASARAEVYQFKWGFWRRGTKELEPGDSVAAEIRIPDYAKIFAAMPTDSSQPNAPQQPAQPGSGGRGGKGGGLAPTPTAPAAPQPDAQGTPTGGQVPMTTSEVAAKEIILGVGMGQIRDAAGKPKNASQVFVREEDGTVMVVTPDEQRMEPAYARVSRSATRGENETKPQADKPKTPGQPTNPGGNTPAGGGRGG